MRPRLPVRIWLDPGEPPAGWIRGGVLADELARLRARRVRALALGAPAATSLAMAQALEQGAFNGTIPRCEVEIRLPDGDERIAVETAIAAARRHWDNVPTRPPEVPPRPGMAGAIVRGILLHVAGFLVVIALFEVWSLAVRHEHAAGVDWVVKQVRGLFHRGVR